MGPLKGTLGVEGGGGFVVEDVVVVLRVGGEGGVILIDGVIGGSTGVIGGSTGVVGGSGTSGVVADKKIFYKLKFL